MTASEVFGVKPEQVTSQMRRNAKTVNFGIIYGISEFGLSKNLKCPVYQDKKYMETYFEKFKAIKSYLEGVVEEAKERGYTLTLLNRTRKIPELKSRNYMQRQFGERAAMNMPLQGSSADIIKLAMLGVYNRLKKENLKSELILQVHDELIIDAFKEEAEKVKKILIEEMEGAVKLSVDLTVSVGEGETWFDAK
jgi:DNA polymerase-1